MKIKDSEIKELINKARSALPNSYSPYSGIKIAAAVLSTSGGIVSGVNVENASYGLSICAERAALFKAVSEGIRDFKAMCIYSEDVEPYPCGACLQVISEFFAGDNPVIICNKDSVKMYKLSELYPYRFKLEKK